MYEQDVNLFLMSHQAFFPMENELNIKKQLMAAPIAYWPMIIGQSYNDPTTILIVSVFGGWLGIDRFIIGDVGIGVGKLCCSLLCGIGLVWWLVDIFLIQDATRKKNYEKLNSVLNVY